MILEYHRPSTLEEALGLLNRPQPPTRPLGGGTLLNLPGGEAVAVVDLQNLGLDKIRRNGATLDVGATVTLQTLVEHEDLQPDLRRAARLEANLHLRQIATLAGTLVAADGRSPLTTALLALDARLTILPGEGLTVGNLLPLRHELLKGRLITAISIPLNVKLAYAATARTPADRPIVCVALAAWPSGRTRLAVGGWGRSPSLAMDGPDPNGVEAAARNACHDAGDEWASAEYRTSVAVTLARRCLDQALAA